MYYTDQQCVQNLSALRQGITGAQNPAGQRMYCCCMRRPKCGIPLTSKKIIPLKTPNITFPSRFRRSFVHVVHHIVASLVHFIAVLVPSVARVVGLGLQSSSGPFGSLKSACRSRWSHLWCSQAPGICIRLCFHRRMSQNIQLAVEHHMQRVGLCDLSEVCCLEGHVPSIQSIFEPQPGGGRSFGLHVVASMHQAKL